MRLNAVVACFAFLMVFQLLLFLNYAPAPERPKLRAAGPLGVARPRAAAGPPRAPQDFYNREFLLQHLESIVGFWLGRVIDASGGYYQNFYDNGTAFNPQFKSLVSSARMVMNFCLAGRLLRRPELFDIARHGLDYVERVHWQRDRQFYAFELTDHKPVSMVVQSYAIGFVLAMHAHARMAGVHTDNAPIERVYDRLEQFWLPEFGAYADTISANGVMSDYRGQNTNLHICEGMIAAYEATRERRYLDRARTIVETFMVRLAKQGGGLIWEHYTKDWEIDWNYNKERVGTQSVDPLDLYRPWGFQPGHNLEWPRNALNVYRHSPEDWLLVRSREVFDKVWSIAWDNEYGGLRYSFAPNGSWINDDKYFWLQAESFGSAAHLYQATGEAKYLEQYDMLWQYSWNHFVDHRYGSWWRILRRNNTKYDDRKDEAGAKCDYHQVFAISETLKDMPAPAPPPPQNFYDREFLLQHLGGIVDFWLGRVVDKSGGFYQNFYDDGAAFNPRFKSLVSSARMVMNFCLAGRLLGRPELLELARHGLDYVEDVHWQRDRQFYAFELEDNRPVSTVVQSYAYGFVLAMHAHARMAGVHTDNSPIERVYERLEQRFWLPDFGAYADTISADGVLSDYRGQNTNLHICEGMIAAYEATKERRYLDRARTIVETFMVRLANQSGGIIWEHYTKDWHIDWDYNKERVGTQSVDPLDLYRPWGFQPGHNLEWPRNALNIYRHVREGWLLTRSREVFDKIWSIAWDNEYGGLRYSFAPNGTWINDDKYFWLQAESFGSAAHLYQATGASKYLEQYNMLWQYSWKHFVDHKYGSWWRILRRNNTKYDDRKDEAGAKCDYHQIFAISETLKDMP